MSSSGTVVVRRTWPQRLVILCSVGVVAASIGASWFLNDVYGSFTDLGRVEFAADVLITDTDPAEPVNFLLIGEDSAEGLDPNDPAAFARPKDSRGRFQADSVTVLRVNPSTGQAWVLSLPRDLLVDDRGTERKISSLLLVDGQELLVETITANFGITLNHYMSLDFLGFREVVDELGGIPVWFDHPARDRKPNGETGSGLEIATAGCHVLNGEQALQYVRSRNYQELIDGEWERVGNSDFGRVERQQDFLVLALERAIDRGARNPANLASLVAAGASSLVLDDELTVAELIDVGEAFSNFNPENLDRYALEVATEYDEADRYLGERAVEGRNDSVFAVFRGEADLRRASDVAFDIYGSDRSETDRIAVELQAQGFAVDRRLAIDEVETGNVVVYPPGERPAAETIARYLLPIPRLVEDPAASALSVVLGSEHEQVLILIPHEVLTMRAAVAGLGEGSIPSLDGANEFGTTSTSTTTTMPAAPATTAGITTTTAGPIEDPSPPTTSAGIIGRAPEGQSCG